MTTTIHLKNLLHDGRCLVGYDDHGEYVASLDRSRFGGGWGIFRGFLNLGGTDDGIDTEGIHRGVQSLGGRVRDQ